MVEEIYMYYVAVDEVVALKSVIGVIRRYDAMLWANSDRKLPTDT